MAKNGVANQTIENSDLLGAAVKSILRLISV